jgi:hypothetical protein
MLPTEPPWAASSARRWACAAGDRPALGRAGGSPQPGGATSTENRYQLKVMPTGANPLVLLFCPERRRPWPAPPPEPVADRQ